MTSRLLPVAQMLGTSQVLRAASQAALTTSWSSAVVPAVCVCLQQMRQGRRYIQSSSASAQQTQQQQAAASTTEQASTSSGSNDADPAPASSQQAEQTDRASSGASSSTADDAQQSTGSASQQAEEMRQKVFGGFKTGFDSFKTRFGTAGGSSSSTGEGGAAGGQQGGQQQDSSARLKQVWEIVKRELADAVLPREEQHSASKAYEGKVYQPEEYSGTTAMQLVKQPETRWERTRKRLQEKMSEVPVFRNLLNIKVAEAAPVKKAGEIAEDLKERWETSDHPMVHKVEDVKARLFDPSEQARTMAEIRSRDPSFDMNEFIKAVRNDAPVVVKAFLTHDLATLGKHCGPELLERFDGIFKHYASQGLFDDPTILFTSEVELVEVKMIEEEPMAVIRFNCHQLKCTRDKFGNVVEGSPDSLQRVYYFWGLQQDKHGVVTEEGKLLPPRWVLKDMMWQSMLALV